MNIIFKKLTIENFMSFENETFDFSSNRGLNLICGRNHDIPLSKNGTGKSNLPSALMFALYGSTLNGVTNQNIPNRYIDSSIPTTITLQFQVDDNEYRIISGMKAKIASTYCSLYKLNKESGEYEDITKSSVRETRKYIANEILKFDHSIFLRTILLTSDQVYNFFKLRKFEKTKFIESIFDLAIFGKMYELIHKDVLAIDKELYALQKEYFTFNSNHLEYSKLESKYDKNKKTALKKFSDELKTLIIEYKQCTTSDESDDRELSTLRDSLQKIDEIIVKLKDMKYEVTRKIDKIDIRCTHIHQYIHDRSLHLKQHVTVYKDLCELCSPIFDTHYSIKTTKNDIIDKQKEYRNLKKESQVLSEKLKVIDEKMSSLSNKKISINAKLSSVERELSSKKSRINGLKLKIASIKNKQDTLADESNPYTTQCNNAKEALTTSRDVIDIHVKNVNHLRYLEDIVSHDTIRKHIVKDLVKMLNIQIKLYLSKMGAKFTCEFDENLNYTFYTDSGETEYEAFSSGEKMRMSIATSLAFRDFMSTRSNINANVLILDEYIDSNLDSLAIGELIKILKEFILLYGQDVYIVSHRKEIDNDIFDNIIIVEKENGISRITYDKP